MKKEQKCIFTAQWMKSNNTRTAKGGDYFWCGLNSTIALYSNGCLSWFQSNIAAVGIITSNMSTCTEKQKHVISSAAYATYLCK